MIEHIKDSDHCTIYGWMLKLGLDYRRLMIFAQIYGFTKAKGMFFYRREWLAEWADCSPEEMDMAIGSLIYDGLVKRQEVETSYGKTWVLEAELREEDL